MVMRWTRYKEENMCILKGKEEKEEVQDYHDNDGDNNDTREKNDEDK